ncbi:MAG: carboxylating nicotinate-nucleotide diphosphorylase [Flavobacteriales bacterium]
MTNNQEHFDRFIKSAIAEDIANGDHSSLSTIPESSSVKAQIISKDTGVIAGVNRAIEIFHSLDKTINITAFVKDGDSVVPKQKLLALEGNARSILMMERIALNCMQRMSGIATYTKSITSKISHTKCKLLDTRKTAPGLRFLEKEAVVIGGGMNHRMGLYDMIMIKDNHIDFSGGIENAVLNANQYIKDKGLDLKIEIEVRNFEELDIVLNIGKVHRIMLDNFTPDNLKKAVQKINKRFETEASGGITENSIVAYAETGVDYISVGALTHSVKNFDISLIAQKND